MKLKDLPVITNVLLGSKQVDECEDIGLVSSLKTRRSASVPPIRK